MFGRCVRPQISHSVGIPSSRRGVNLVAASRPSTANSKLRRRAVATSGRNEVFRRPRGGRRRHCGSWFCLDPKPSCLFTSARSTYGRNYTVSSDGSPLNKPLTGLPCRRRPDVRYWMSVSEWLPSVSRDDVRVDGHTDVDDQGLPRRRLLMRIYDFFPPRTLPSPGKPEYSAELAVANYCIGQSAPLAFKTYV